MPAGRPPTDPAILGTAIAAVASGEPIEEVGKRLGISHMTIRREQERRRLAARTGAPIQSEGARGDPGGQRTVQAPPVFRERPPEGLTGNALQLWYVQRQIEMVSNALAEATGPNGQLARIAPLNEQLRKWLAELARLTPPEAPDPAEEDRRWRAEGEEVLRKIEAGVAAVEAQLARAG